MPSLAAMAVPQNETSALCMDCGMCCNGAIYDHAPVNPDEIELTIDGGFDVLDVSEGKAFSLPCKHLCGAACTIYEQPRPFVCGDYFCRLATNLTIGEVTFGEAQGRVRAAQVSIEQLRPLLLEGETLAQARKRWKALKPGTMSADDARFAILMAGLNRQLDRFFRYDSQVLMRPPAEEAGGENAAA